MLNILYAMLYFYKKAVLCSSWADEQWRSNVLNYTLVGLSVRYCDVPIFLFLQQLFIVPPCFSVQHNSVAVQKYFIRCYNNNA